jgi:hypothetical protein
MGSVIRSAWPDIQIACNEDEVDRLRGISGTALRVEACKAREARDRVAAIGERH